MNHKVIAFVAILFLGSGFAKADTYATFASAAAFGGNDTLTWGQLGVDLTSVISGATATSANGLSVKVTDTGGFSRRDEGAGWTGNFTIGDQLLWDQGGGPVTLSFSRGISGIGFNIQNNFSGSFTATITLSDGTPFTLPGTASGSENGSAAFFGVKDLTGANILALTIATSAPGANDFAFNRLLLVDSPTTSPAISPEPSSFMLLGTGLLALGGAVKARLPVRG